MNKQLQLQKFLEKLSFSGAYFVNKNGETLTGSHKYANYSEKIKNQIDTRFPIASGSKIFTSVAIGLLVEREKISFDTRLKDCVSVNFPYFNKDITIHHLLTHTSGVPDYFNENEMDDYEVLWQNTPMYQMREPKDFLPLFQNEKMQNRVGQKFHYNNAGYILLGLVIEHITKERFTDFIEKHIFQKIGMKDSGYFELDCLPERTALGYLKLPTGELKSNIYSIPAKGGPDGGAFVTVKDMAKFWHALMNNQLLSKKLTCQFIRPREVVVEEDYIYYGYAGFMEVNADKEVTQFIQMGYDPGINYRAVYVPKHQLTIIVCSNESEHAYEVLKEIESII